jgi:hypothetical protein
MTRTGKIARLPLSIRQQLNQRLQNGELAQDLLSWLNRSQKSRPSDESNLCHWKQGRLSRQEKPQRIRQIMGIGQEHAPESLFTAATRTKLR